VAPPYKANKGGQVASVNPDGPYRSQGEIARRVFEIQDRFDVMRGPHGLLKIERPRLPVGKKATDPIRLFVVRIGPGPQAAGRSMDVVAVDDEGFSWPVEAFPECLDATDRNMRDRGKSPEHPSPTWGTDVDPDGPDEG
jgi:hypothetical protein